MKISNVAQGITQLSIDVENILFEGLWEMPDGVTINSYIVKGEQTALIDGVCGWDGVPETFFGLLEQLEIELSSIRYLVLNHLEPDHAGWIANLLKVHRDFEIYCTDKGAELYKAFFGENVKINIVKDGDYLDLGAEKRLTFHTTPHVHWPDAMVTYDESTGTLFTCDIFGSFGRMADSIFDDDYTDEQLAQYEQETIRYYSNILATFSTFAAKAVVKCQALQPTRIAPGHGIVWQSRVDKIMNDYLSYAAYQSTTARKEVTLLWGSMYGMTQNAVKVAETTLKELGVKYHIHQVPATPIGEILTSVWTSSAVILAMPTYEYKMFPPMAAVLDELGRKKVLGRQAFRFGSYGWSGGAQKELDEIIERLKMNWCFIPSHEFRGQPTAVDLQVISERVKELVGLL
jgi:anaerobic nitric oxide reductase flavorubredoxin